MKKSILRYQYKFIPSKYGHYLHTVEIYGVLVGIINSVEVYTDSLLLDKYRTDTKPTKEDVLSYIKTHFLCGIDTALYEIKITKKI